jgi:hypothetical protein
MHNPSVAHVHPSRVPRCWTTACGSRGRPPAMWFGKPIAICATLTVVLGEPLAEIIQAFGLRSATLAVLECPDDEWADPVSLPGQRPVGRRWHVRRPRLVRHDATPCVG